MYQGTYQPPTQFSVFPPVIKNLLILNGLLFLAQIVPETNNTLIYWFGLWPLGDPPIPLGQFWPWQLVSYAFLHGNFSHLLFNMFALWMFGVQVENTWGSQRFSMFYFACVIGAAALQLIVATAGGGWYPTIGASGGVFGLLLAFGMMFPDQPIYLYFLFPVKAKWFVIGYGLIELYAGVVGNSTVAHFAHLGGMAFGFLLIQYWRGKLPWKPRQRMYW
jgi:membrane associated rhomboid family serine protease